MRRIIEMARKYEQMRPYVEQLPDIFDRQGEEIYHLRNTIKVFQAPNGILINVKRFHVPALPNRLVYSLGVRKPKGRRAFVYPDMLLSHGIRTPEPVALIEERNCLGLLGYTYFVSIQCDYGHTLYEVGQMRDGEYEELAEALARLAAAMHGQGILHKDFTPGNVLWKHDEQGYHFSLVDINRMYFGEVNMREGLCNLTRMWGPKRFTQILVRRYADIRGFDKDEAEAMALTERARFWKKYQRKHEIPFHLEL